MGRWTARTVLCGATLLALAFGGGVAAAALPGQNGKIAHTFGPGSDIWSINPDGSDATQLTSGPAWDLHPSWSPDGERIAFMSSRSDPDPVGCFPSCVWDIHLVNTDGTGLTRITEFGARSSRWPWPVWAPDGQRIAYVGDEGHVWAIAPDGSGLRRLSGDRGSCYVSFGGPLSWSPDGKEIGTAASQSCFDDSLNCLLAVATGATTCWGAVADSIADWSPDSQWVLIGSDGASYPDPGAGLWRRKVRPPNVGETVALTPGWQADDGLEGDAAWSPDGTTVIFRRDVWDGPGSGVYLADAGDGGNMRPFPGPIGCCYDWHARQRPRRADYKNQATFCRAEREFLGEQSFRATYGTNGGSNAFGKCVSGK